MKGQNPFIQCIPSWELTYPIPRHLEDEFPFPLVGYVSFLEGIPFCIQATRSSRPLGMIGSVMKGWGWSARTWSIKYLVSLQEKTKTFGPVSQASTHVPSGATPCTDPTDGTPPKLRGRQYESQDAWLAINRPNFSPDLHQVCNSWTMRNHVRKLTVIW